MSVNRRILLACAVLLACVAVLYGQVADHELLTYDDPDYFSENARVTAGLSLESVQWAFTTLEQGNWHPLTWLSYMAGVELAGTRPGPHLLVNALLHGANTVLLFLVLSGYTGTFWRALAVAVLFDPPQLIPLVEIVPGEQTSRETVDFTVRWIASLGKEPVRLNKECPGFIGNRLQLALLREALYIVEQGYADIEEVDKSMIHGHGRRLPVTGPFLSADMGGLDIFHIISGYLFRVLCNSREPSPLMQELVKKGDLGMKSGKGFYDWTPEMKERTIKRRTETLVHFLDEDRKKARRDNRK